MNTEPHVGKVTELGPPGWLAPVFALCGAVAGPLVELLARWLLTLPWAPFEGPARLLTSVPQPWLTIGVIVAGAVLGLIVALIAAHEELKVRVTPDAVTLTREDDTHTYARTDVALACLDGKQLVLMGHDSGELARESCDLNGRRLAEAFAGHGWPWADADPHRDAFRLWVPDLPGLPTGADALLKARARALKRSGGAAEARELRAELARLGVFVRDGKKDGHKRQYWRGIVTPRDPS